jgi:hypothetical protein
VVIEGPVSELHPAHSAIKVLTDDQTNARLVIADMFGPASVAFDEEYLVVESVDGGVPEMARRLMAGGIGIEALIPAREQGLEDFFLGLTESADVDASRTPVGAKGGAR